MIFLSSRPHLPVATRTLFPGKRQGGDQRAPAWSADRDQSSSSNSPEQPTNILDTSALALGNSGTNAHPRSKYFCTSAPVPRTTARILLHVQPALSLELQVLPFAHRHPFISDLSPTSHSRPPSLRFSFLLLDDPRRPPLTDAALKSTACPTFSGLLFFFVSILAFLLYCRIRDGVRELPPKRLRQS